MGGGRLSVTMASRDLYAYIDETGDRGPSSRSSPIFGMAAVLVDDAGAAELRDAVRHLRNDLRVPDQEVMSWKDHAKDHDRRKRAAELLGAVRGIRVSYVYVVKSELAAESYLTHSERFYNYICYKTYKSVLWSARNWKGSGARLWTRFGHVRNHDHRSTKAYIEVEASKDEKVPDSLEQGLRWVSADKYLESQAADMYGGFLKAATWPSGTFNYVEPNYLLQVWPQLRNSGSCAIPLGIMSMPRNDLLQQNSWFPCANCPK